MLNIIIGGEVCDEIKTNKLLRAAMRDLNFWGKIIGSVGNFSIKVRSGDEITLVGHHNYNIQKPNYFSIQQAINSGIANVLLVEIQRLAQAEQDLISLDAMVGKPFEHLERMQTMRSRINEINLLLQQEQADKPDIRYCTDTSCSTYIEPETEIIEELLAIADRPTWLSEILDMMPKAQPFDLVLGNGQRQPEPGDLVMSNIIEFPIQKLMTKLEVLEIEYKFEKAKTARGRELEHLQGCLF
jgi:hypothetical protein